jgi:hypothetical protein
VTPNCSQRFADYSHLHHLYADSWYFLFIQTSKQFPRSHSKITVNTSNGRTELLFRCHLSWFYQHGSPRRQRENVEVTTTFYFVFLSRLFHISIVSNRLISRRDYVSLHLTDRLADIDILPFTWKLVLQYSELYFSHVALHKCKKAVCKFVYDAYVRSLYHTFLRVPIQDKIKFHSPFNIRSKAQQK